MILLPTESMPDSVVVNEMVAEAPILLAKRSELLKLNIVLETFDRHGQISKSLVNTIELSKDTATGATRFWTMPSPTCAYHKASQPRHKTVHPTLLPLPSNPPRNSLAPAHSRPIPSTINLQMTQQSHMCVPANASVSSSNLPSKYPTSHLMSHILYTTLTPHHRPNPSCTTHTSHTLLNIKTQLPHCTQNFKYDAIHLHAHAQKLSKARTTVSKQRALVHSQLPP